MLWGVHRRLNCGGQSRELRGSVRVGRVGRRGHRVVQRLAHAPGGTAGVRPRTTDLLIRVTGAEAGPDLAPAPGDKHRPGHEQQHNRQRNQVLREIRRLLLRFGLLGGSRRGGRCRLLLRGGWARLRRLVLRGIEPAQDGHTAGQVSGSCSEGHPSHLREPDLRIDQHIGRLHVAVPALALHGIADHDPRRVALGAGKHREGGGELRLGSFP